MATVVAAALPTDLPSAPADHPPVCRLTKVASRSYIWVMRAVGLKVLKNKLSEYVRLVQGGEIVLVTDRDRVVAELVPPEAGRGTSVADAVLAELVRKGWVTPAPRPLNGPPPRLPIATLAELMREMEADRADR